MLTATMYIYIMNIHNELFNGLHLNAYLCGGSIEINIHINDIHESYKRNNMICRYMYSLNNNMQITEQ